MALVSVNTRLHGWERERPLNAALANLPEGAPVILMIHGYRFSPQDDWSNPHRHILAFRPSRRCWKAVSWPRHLHLNRPGAGLGIGFGWHALGTLGAVAARAFETGTALAALITHIHRRRPGTPVHLLAHSLGARVVLSALPHLPSGSVSRIILLSGAAYSSEAKIALATPAGRRAEILNVASGENLLFDTLFRLCVPAPRLANPVLSCGLDDQPNWTDLRVDCPQSRAALRDFGIRMAPPRTRICHWSTYLRPGLFGLYRRVFDPSTPDTLRHLAPHLPRPTRWCAWAQQPQIADFCPQSPDAERI